MNVFWHTKRMSRNGYQWADSAAARMMAAALARAKGERGLSIRQLGKRLGYKQATVLSHMANGKTPIPIDRAEDLANELDLDAQGFLRAVLDQRHPEVDWSLLGAQQSQRADDGLANQLEIILGAPLEHLNPEQKYVLREVVADPIPARRWLSVHELPSYKEFQAGRLTLDEAEEIVEELASEDRRYAKEANQ